MATALAQIKVTRMEAQQGFLITCSQCDWRAVRHLRASADITGLGHQRSHGQHIVEVD